MFLCLSITFISSISEIRSARSLSVASSEDKFLSFRHSGFLTRSKLKQVLSFIFTFEHLDRHGGGLVRTVFVDPKGFGSDHLTEAAFS